MRANALLAAVVLAAAMLQSCGSTTPPLAELEPHIAIASEVDPPPPPDGKSKVTPITPEAIKAKYARALAQFGGERVVMLRFHEWDDRPVIYANALCLGTQQRGTMTDETGVAWLHGMESDSVTVKLTSPGIDAVVIRAEVRIGQVVGFDVRSVRKPGSVQD